MSHEQNPEKKAFYYSSGSKRSELTFLHGKLAGLCLGWYENGDLRFKGSCNSKGKHGLWSHFDVNGNSSFEYWNDGKQIITSIQQGKALEKFRLNIDKGQIDVIELIGTQFSNKM